MFEIGNTLREARLQRRIDLVEAEQDTKIRSKYLGALEGEDFDLLPGAVYARGFLRTYSRYLGLDPQQFIDEYNGRFGQFEDADEAPVRKMRPLPERRGVSLRTVLVLSLAAIAVLGWLGLRSGEKSTVSDTAVSNGKLGTGSANDLIKRHDVPDDRAGAARNAAATTPPPAPTRAKLSVTARGGATWIEVRRGGVSGVVIFVGNLSDGTVKRFAARRLVVTVGAPMYTVLKSRSQRIASTSTASERWTIGPKGISALRGA